MTFSTQDGGRVSSASWILIWVLLSVLPFIPYTFPLFEVSLTNSPTAYLIWVPVLAFFWAGWNMNQVAPRARMSADYSLWWAFFLSVTVGGLLVAGAYLGPGPWTRWFFANDIALLLWPLWSLGILWVMHGPSVTKAVIKPLIYLIAVWPPIYLKLIDAVNPFLSFVTTSLINSFASLTGWMHEGASADLFAVRTGSDWTTIHVSNSCSGSDSILALLVLFPITLVFFQSSVLRKFLLVLIGCFLVFVFNVVRICMIATALHLFGYKFAFDVLHPVLGSIFFLLIVSGLLIFGSKKAVSRSRAGFVSQRPGIVRTVVATLVTLVVIVMLLPMYTWREGSELKPVLLATNDLIALMPNVDGYAHPVLTQAGSAGSDPSTNSATTVYNGPAHSEIFVQLSWLGSTAESDETVPLEAGGRILGQHAVTVRPGIRGTSYRLSKTGDASHKPDVQYVETEFIYVAVYNAQRVYVQVRLSSAAGSTVFGKFQNAFTDALLQSADSSGLDSVA